MEPYEYTERDGEKLRIEHGPNGGAWLTVSNHGWSRIVEVAPESVPGAALALYEAAGLTKPLMLPRPALEGVNLAYFGNVFTGRSGSMVTVGWRRIEPQELDPHEALELAAQIAVNAQTVLRDEPDPDKISELADLLLAGAPMSRQVAEALSRKALLAGWTRQDGQQ
jgi:hypothetical protein